MRRVLLLSTPDWPIDASGTDLNSVSYLLSNYLKEDRSKRPLDSVLIPPSRSSGDSLEPGLLTTMLSITLLSYSVVLASTMPGGTLLSVSTEEETLTALLSTPLRRKSGGPRTSQKKMMMMTRRRKTNETPGASYQMIHI